jgi:hypothetical protein
MITVQAAGEQNGNCSIVALREVSYQYLGQCIVQLAIKYVAVANLPWIALGGDCHCRQEALSVRLSLLLMRVPESSQGRLLLYLFCLYTRI